MRNCNLRECHMWVILLFPQWQVWLLVRQLLLWNQDLLNWMQQVLRLTSHVYWYPPYHSHSHPPSLLSSSTTLLSSHNTGLEDPSLSLHVMVTIKYLAENTADVLYTAFTRDCLSSLDSYNAKLGSEFDISFQHASLASRPPPAHSPWELKGQLTGFDSHSCK